MAVRAEPLAVFQRVRSAMRTMYPMMHVPGVEADELVTVFAQPIFPAEYGVP